MKFELGDIVRPLSYTARVPGHIKGEVVKVNTASVLVKWDQNSVLFPVVWWTRGGPRRLERGGIDKTRMGVNNLILIERRGGPW